MFNLNLVYARRKGLIETKMLCSGEISAAYKKLKNLQKNS